MKIAFTFLLTLVTLNCIAQKNDIITYAKSSMNSYNKMQLIDNTFLYKTKSFTCFNSGKIKIVSGTYVIINKQLSLKPLEVRIETYGERKLLKNVTELPYIDVDSLIINTEYKVVNWDNYSYLLTDQNKEGKHIYSLNEFQNLSSYYNVNKQPKNCWNMLRKKIKPLKNKGLDLTQIPNKWQYFFLKKPLRPKLKELIK